MTARKPAAEGRETGAETSADAEVAADNAVPADEGTGSGAAVLRNRPFLLLWLSQVATQIGVNMVLYGLTVVVLDRRT